MSGLSGKRIVNTRAVHQAGELDELLRARGSIPLAYPCIAIEPPADTTALDLALRDLLAGAFDWLVLTSANSVHALANGVGTHCNASVTGPNASLDGARMVDTRSSVPHVSCLHHADALQCVPTRLAVVGPGTAEAAESELGLRAEVMPPIYRAVDLAEEMPVEPGQRVLIPQSEIAAPDLADALTAKGAVVTTVTAYRTVIGSGGVDLPALLTRGEVDAVIFASSSAVDGFFTRLVSDQWSVASGQLSDSDHWPLTTVAVVCIGPNTAETARTQGLSPIIPAEQTLAGIIDALESEFATLSKGLAS